MLFIMRQAPHTGTYTQAMLDMMMTVAAFDQQVSIFLVGKAVFQLKNNQAVSGTGFKDTAALFKSLPLYDINQIYIEIESLQEQGLTPDDLSEDFHPLSRQQLGEFYQQFDLVLSV